MSPFLNLPNWLLSYELSAPIYKFQMTDDKWHMSDDGRQILEDGRQLSADW